MPLSRPQSRNLLHLRDIQLRGYERADGLIDIEARMTDTKPYSWGEQPHGLNAGEPVHDMWMRLTVDLDMRIHACEAAMDATPYSVCTAAAPNFAQLAGLTIGKGFLREAMRRVGNVAGCTHLRELLQPLGTVAYQTIYSLQVRRRAATQQADAAFINPALINTCLAYDEHGPLVQNSRPLAPERA